MPNSELYDRCYKLYRSKRLQRRQNVRQQNNGDFGRVVIHYGCVGGRVVMIFHEYPNHPKANYFTLVRDGDEDWALVYDHPEEWGFLRQQDLFNASVSAVQTFLTALES